MNSRLIRTTITSIDRAAMPITQIRTLTANIIRVNWLEVALDRTMSRIVELMMCFTTSPTKATNFTVCHIIQVIR